MSQSLKDQGKSRTMAISGQVCSLSTSQSLKDQGKSRTRAACKAYGMPRCRNPLKIRASLGPEKMRRGLIPSPSQSLKDQGKSRTAEPLLENSVKAASQSLKDQGKSRTQTLFIKVAQSAGSQSLKDQGKSRTLDSLAFARRQSFSLRKH